MAQMSQVTAPLSTKWIIRLLLGALIITSFVGGYYNVRFELLQHQIEAQTNQPQK